MRGIRDLDEGTIRRIDWRELLPGTLILRGLTFSLRLSPILFGAFSVLMMLLVTENLPLGSFAATGAEEAVGDFFRAAETSFSASSPQGRPTFPFGAIWEVAAPIWEASYEQTPILWERPGRTVSFLFIASLWTGFFGLALARSAAVRIASTERSGCCASVRFACRKFPSVVLAAGIALCGIALCELPGLLTARFLPQSIYFALTPIFLFLSLLAALLAAGLFFGFPLMIAAVAADRCDGFDAFSRTFSYVFQRPIHFLFYVVCAVLLAAVGFQIVSALAFLVEQFFPTPDSLQVSGGSPCGEWYYFWRFLLTIAPLGFLWSAMLSFGVAIYFILRRSVDGTPFDTFSPNVNQPPRSLSPLPPITPIPTDGSSENAADDAADAVSGDAADADAVAADVAADAAAKGASS